MKILHFVLFAGLSANGIAGLLEGESTAKNSVPVSMDIHFISNEGKEFHLYRNKGFFTENGVCKFRTVTRYEIDHSFDVHAKEVTIEVTTDDWIRFRRALRGVGFEKMKSPTDEDVPIKTSIWTVIIKYPDGEIAAQEANAPGMEGRFAALRKAIAALTKAKWP